MPNVGSNKTRSRRDRLRCAVESGVCVVIAAVVLQTWFVVGLLIPCRISGGSMAAAFLGRHYEITCAACGHRYCCDAEDDAPVCAAVCPNCSYAGNALEAAVMVPGDRVAINRVSFCARPPQRWELVAFHPPERADRIAVKRVVGLPGENVEIRYGDVYANGCVQRKTLAQQRAMAVLVHEAACQPSRPPLPPPRWQAADDHARWTCNNTCFSHAADPAAQTLDWLTYHHGHRQAGRPDQLVETPIQDLGSYNPARPRRETDVHAVPDILLAVQLANLSGRGEIVFRMTDGAEVFAAALHFDDGAPWFQVLHNGRPLAGIGGTLSHGTPASSVEVSLIDQQFVLAVNSTTLAAVPFARNQPPCPPATPLAIGVCGLGATLRDIRIYRDVYYTHPMGSAAAWGIDAPARLAADEYYVLGDNSAISIDSRTWPEQRGIAAACLLGKPLLLAFP